MSLEIWKPIDGYAPYMVSSWGRVMNGQTGNVLAPHPNKKGYLRVDLYLDGEKKHKRVNRLVAQAFIPNPDGLPQVNHIDGNKQNNSVTNLEWCTNDDNNKHRQKIEYLVIHSTDASEIEEFPIAVTKVHFPEE